MPRSKVIPLERVSELYSTFPGSKVIPFDSLAFEGLAFGSSPFECFPFESYSVRKSIRSKIRRSGILTLRVSGVLRVGRGYGPA